MNRIVLVSIASALAACANGTAPQHTLSFDLAGADAAGDLSNPGDAGAPLDGGSSCATYSKSTVAAMRQAATSGCFELDGVVTVATTPISTSSTSIRIIAQDSAGGDYSGIVLNCYDSSTTKYPCTAFPTAKNILAGRTVTVQGFYEKAPAAKGSYEYLSIDSITDTAAGTAPAPAAAVLADIERDGNKPALWFQKVAVTISAADKLKAYDWTPTELKSTTKTSGCGAVYGFGMLPTSATGTAAPACSGTTTQPTGQTSPSANEVLFGTEFHTGFTANSECTCLKSSTMMPYPGLMQSTSTLSGAVSGILFYDAFNTMTGYQYLSPLKDTDAPITNLSM